MTELELQGYCKSSIQPPSLVSPPSPFYIEDTNKMYVSYPGQPKQTNAYATLDDDEKENIKTILFIMDRFSISLEGNNKYLINQKIIEQ